MWLILVALLHGRAQEPAVADVTPPPRDTGEVAAPAAAPAAATPATPTGAPAAAPVSPAVGSLFSNGRTPPRRVPERWTIPPDVLETVRAARNEPLAVRMEAATRPFLDLPYTKDAAGEGSPEDPDPLARYDTFDCMTFAEEILGLTLSADPIYTPLIRNALRFNGEPSYLHRRHFMEAQWIPDAIRDGLLVDITDRLGPTRTLSKALTVESYKSCRKIQLMRLPDYALPLGSWTLHYLDLDAAAAAAPKIPPGALVFTVRTERSHVPVVTTHVSMVVQTPKGPIMRHASQLGSKKVRSDDVSWFVRHIRTFVNWPGMGIVVLMPREQGPRISALSAAPLPTGSFPPASGPVPVYTGVKEVE